MYGLHVRTVRRYIREGRLQALRIGNRYRISRDDLEAFTGREVELPAATPPGRAPLADVSSIVDLQPMGRDDAERLTALLSGAVKGRDADDAGLRLDMVYDPQRTQLKVVVIGTIAHASSVLARITTFLEQRHA